MFIPPNTVQFVGFIRISSASDNFRMFFPGAGGPFVKLPEVLPGCSADGLLLRGAALFRMEVWYLWRF